MRLRRILIPILLLLPLLEVFVLVKVGQAIGGLNTVLLVVLMAIVGLVLMRLQGMATIDRARAAMARGELPALPLLEGLWLVLAGVLLLIPGFVTDVFGLALFVPPIRRGITRLLAGSLLVPVRRSSGPGPDRGGPRPIEGEFTRRDE